MKRKHTHIIEIGLTLLAQASLPLNFWPDLFSTIVYLNRLLPKVLSDKSPIEKLFNIKPGYQRLNAFGCLCFPCLRSYNIHKLDYRSPCPFLGYALHKIRMDVNQRMPKVYMINDIQSLALDWVWTSRYTRVLNSSATA